MTPHEKAQQLIGAFFNPIDIGDFEVSCRLNVAIDCAKMAVSHAILEMPQYYKYTMPNPYADYWRAVLNELNDRQQKCNLL